MKKTTLLLLLFLFINYSFAQQTIGYQWAKKLTPGGIKSGKCLTVDSNGNVYVFQGDTGSNNDYNNYLQKYDKNGTVLWSKLITAKASYFDFNGIVVDANENVFITVSLAGTINFTPNTPVFNGSWTTNIAKFDKDGNYLWAKNIVTRLSHQPSIKKLGIDGVGNLYITGEFLGIVDFDPGSGTANVGVVDKISSFFAKYDNNGNYIYAKKIGEFVNNSSNAFYTKDLFLDNKGNIYVCGQFVGTHDFDPGLGIVNLSSVSTTSKDLFFAKYDSEGNYLWVKSIGMPTDSGVMHSLAVDKNGNVYITGNFEGTVDFDSGPVIVNLTKINTATDKYRGYLVKYDANGNYVWVKNIGGSSLSLDNLGNIYLIGQYYKTTDFDLGEGTAILPASSGSDFSKFFAKYDDNGNYKWAKKVDFNSNDVVSGVNGDIYLTGYFFGDLDFD